jgi:hypothetical protein
MTNPTKQHVREWLSREVKAKQPPPSPEQIRRELGWDLLKEEMKHIEQNKYTGQNK